MLAASLDANGLHLAQPCRTGHGRGTSGSVTLTGAESPRGGRPPESRPVRYQSPVCSRVQSSRSISTVPRSTANELASERGYLRRIFSIALPLASSSMSLSR